MSKRFLKEGAGGGHMWHPFDLVYVRNGKDLLNFFEEKVKQYVESGANPEIKLDGSNATVKLIRNQEGEWEFAVDRGSSSQLDVGGVTINDLEARFPKRVVLQLLENSEEVFTNAEKLRKYGLEPSDLEEGMYVNIVHKRKSFRARIKEITPHGMVQSNSVLLDIFNAALNAENEKIVKLVQYLTQQMIDKEGSHLVFNCEMIMEGSTEAGAVNAVTYGEGDVIAIHGMREIFPDPKSKRGARKSDGLPVDKGSIEYRSVAEIVKTLKKHNPHKGTKVFFTPDDAFAELNEDIEIDYSAALSERIPIKFEAAEEPITKTLKQWLNDPELVLPDYTERLPFANGKKMSVFSKQVYQYLIPEVGDPISVQEILGDENADLSDLYMKLVSSAIFYHATRTLGREVLRGYINANKVGPSDLNDHEGITMHNPELFKTHRKIKITGDFIVKGMSGAFSDKKPVNENIDLEKDQMPQVEGKTVAIMPGSFKPPHMGHAKMAAWLAGKADEVLIFVSAPGPSSKRLLPFSNTEISYDKAVELFKMLLRGMPANIKVVESSNPHPSPIQALNQLRMPKEERKYYDDVEIDDENVSKYLLGMSEKEKDDPASMARFSMYEGDPKIQIVFAPAIAHSPEYGKLVDSFVSANKSTLKKLEGDKNVKALEMADSLLSSRASKKLPSNPTFDDYVALLSKANTKKVMKLMKISPENLDRNNFSATDLRILIDMKQHYNMPVDDLLADFVGTNVDQYLREISDSDTLEEIKSIIADYVGKIVLDEMSAMGAGAVEGGARQPPGKRKRSKKYEYATTPENDKWREKKEYIVGESGCGPEHEQVMEPEVIEFEPLIGRLGPPAKLQRVAPINIRIGSSKHRPTGVESDAGFKKFIKNKHIYNITDPISQREPHYKEGDVIEPIGSIYEILVNSKTD